MQITVKDLMTGQPTTVGKNATIDEAMQILLHEQVAELYVTEEGERLLGVIPDYDLLKARMSRLPGEDSVETLMSRSLATIHSESPLEAVVPVFRESCHAQIAVCDAGRLVGTIGRRDVMRLMETMRQLDCESELPCPPISAEIRGPRFMQTRQPVRGTSMGRER